MNRVADIQAAVSKLSLEELARFRAWFQRFDNEAWDRELAEDTEAGRLDPLIEKVVEERRQRRTKER